MAEQAVGRETRFRVVAVSRAKAGDLIVEDRHGCKRLLIGSAGTLSHDSLPPDFFDSVLRTPGWQEVSDDRTYTLGDLLNRLYPDATVTRRSLPSRVASVLGLRSS